MATTIPPMAANGMKTPRTSQAYGGQARETKLLIAKLCRQFYNLGWVSGTGGSITVEVHDDSFPISDQLILMSPSGVQKERMVVDDMYVLSPNGSIPFSPLPKPYPHKAQKCSDYAPLFMKAYDRGNAGAVIHSHGIKSCLVTMIDPLAKEFRAERYHYRSDAAINIHQLGLDPSISSHGPIQKPKGVFGRWKTNKTLKAGARTLDNDSGSTPHCVVLDIEGTTTPISFVTDVLFPYARDNVRMHLEETYDTADTKDDIKLLCSQIEDDLQKGVVGAVPVPLDEADKEGVIAALVANVEEMIKADRKITSLKQLQGHIWRTGFEKNELKGVVYDDVPKALERWHASGVKVYIYSSGSRLAQRLIFGYTNYGDLRKYLCGFFDTRVGNKRETKSYIEISESLGVDKPSDVLFVTDVIQEAVAAKAAGLEVMISVRPGNGPLPENHGFTTIESFTEIPF